MADEPSYPQYKAAKSMVNKVKIEPLTPPGLSSALHINGKATAHLIVSENGTVRDIYLANCTDEHYAQAVALVLKSTHIANPAEECLVEIPCA